MDPKINFLERITFNQISRAGIANAIRHVVNVNVPKEQSEIFIYSQDEYSTGWNKLIGSDKIKLDNIVLLKYQNKRNFYTKLFNGVESEKFLPFLVIIQCNSIKTKNEIINLFKKISSLITFSLFQEYNFRLNNIGHKISRNTLTFPNGSDDIIAYEVLRYAKLVAEKWLKLSYWRVSRTKDSLQEIAKYYNKKRDNIYFENVLDWKFPQKIKIWKDPLSYDKVVVLPELIFITQHSAETNQIKDLKTTFNFLNNQYEVSFEDKQGNDKIVYCYYSIDRTRNYKIENIKDRIKKLLEKQIFDIDETILLLSQNLNCNEPPEALNKIDIQSNIFGPYQTIILIKIKSDEKINLSNLVHLRNVHSLSSITIEQISQSKYNFRTLISIINQISTLAPKEKISKILEKGLKELFDTNHFLIYNSKNNLVLETSKSLRKIQNKKFSHGKDVLDFLALNDCSNCITDSMDLVINIIKAENNNELNKYNHKRNKDIALIEDYQNVGMACIKLNQSLEFVVFSHKYWKIRALEEIALRILSESLRIKFDDYKKNEPINYLVENSVLDFVKFKSSFKVLGDSLIRIIKQSVQHTSILLVAIDNEANFFKPVSSYNILKDEKEALLSFNEEHLIKICYNEKINIKAKYDSKNNALIYKNKQIKFHSFVIPHKYVYAFPLGDSEFYAPKAVLVISADQEIENNKKIGNAVELFSLGLNRKRSDIHNFSNSILNKYLKKLQEKRLFKPYRKHTTVYTNDNNKNNLPLLPSSLNRNYSIEYRNVICDLLNEIRGKTNIASFTIRIKDNYSGTKKLKLWLLANSIKSDPLQYIAFDKLKNIHSYMIMTSQQSIFIPNVKDEKITKKIYPECNYLEKRSETQTELCINIVNNNKRFDATFNIEDKNFEQVWLYEEALRNIGLSIGRELIDDELYSYHGEKSLRKIFNIYLRQPHHNVTNGIYFFSSRLKENNPELYDVLKKDIAQLNELVDNEYTDLDDVSTNIIDLDLLISDSSEKVKKDLVPKYVEIKTIFPSEITKINISAIFTHLFYKLFFEQVSTLKKISEEDKLKITLLCGVRVEPDYIYIDFLSTTPPDETTQEISSSLFWHQIDILGRKGEGRTGLGLVFLGNMLRGIEVVPNAYPNINKKLQQIYGEEFTGIWIELRIKKQKA